MEKRKREKRGVKGSRVREGGERGKNEKREGGSCWAGMDHPDVGRRR